VSPEAGRDPGCPGVECVGIIQGEMSRGPIFKKSYDELTKNLWKKSDLRKNLQKCYEKLRRSYAKLMKNL